MTRTLLPADHVCSQQGQKMCQGFPCGPRARRSGLDPSRAGLAATRPLSPTAGQMPPECANHPSRPPDIRVERAPSIGGTLARAQSPAPPSVRWRHVSIFIERCENKRPCIHGGVHHWDSATAVISAVARGQFGLLRPHFPARMNCRPLRAGGGNWRTTELCILKLFGRPMCNAKLHRRDCRIRLRRTRNDNVTILLSLRGVADAP